MLFSELSGTCVVRWLISTHITLCYGVIAMAFAIGLLPHKTKKANTRKVIYAAIVFFIIQVPVIAILCTTDTIPRLTSTEGLIDTVLDIATSPLLPAVVMWLFLVHIVESCSSCRMMVPKHNIVTRVDVEAITVYILCGVVTTAAIHAITPITQNTSTTIITALTVIAVIGATAELIYMRMKYNIVRVVSMSLCWHVGTWVGAYILAVV